MIGQAPRIATNHSRTRITLTALSTRHLTTAPPDCAASPPPYAHASQPTASTRHSATLGVILNRPRSLRSRASLADRPAPLHCAFLLRSRSSPDVLSGRSPQCCSPMCRRSAGSTRHSVASKRHPASPSLPVSEHSTPATCRFAARRAENKIIVSVIPSTDQLDP
jgi:hypothetical protein